MTPGAFAATYGALADQAASETGLSRWTILSQWAVETGWGTSNLAVRWHNLAGIRWYNHSGTVQVGGTRDTFGSGFAGYSTLTAFLADYVRALRLSYYRALLATAGQPVDVQLVALAASPWDAGHYAGGGLVGAWTQLRQLAPASEVDMLAVVTRQPFPAPITWYTRGGSSLSGYDPAHPGAPVQTRTWTAVSSAHATAVVSVSWPGTTSPPIPRGGPFLEVSDGVYAGQLIVGALVDWLQPATDPGYGAGLGAALDALGPILSGAEATLGDVLAGIAPAVASAARRES